MSQVEIAFQDPKLEELFTKNKGLAGSDKIFIPKKKYHFPKHVIRKVVGLILDFESLKPESCVNQLKARKGLDLKSYDGQHHVRVDRTYRLSFNLEFEDDGKTVQRMVILSFIIHP